MNTRYSINGMPLVLLASLQLTLLSPSAAHAGRYDGLVKGLDDFMGGAASVKRNDTDGFVALGDNGNRFRMDYTGHGDKPHFHLEVPGSNGKHIDAPGVAHRNYFNE